MEKYLMQLLISAVTDKFCKNDWNIDTQIYNIFSPYVVKN